MGFQNKETLCWQCKRPGTGSCSWDQSRAKTPVEGWKAEEVRFREDTGIYTTTYHVIECPLFVPDADYERRTKECGESKQPGRKPRADRSIIENLIRYGWTNEAIARRFGLSPATVQGYRLRWRKKQQEKENEK